MSAQGMKKLYSALQRCSSHTEQESSSQEQKGEKQGEEEPKQEDLTQDPLLSKLPPLSCDAHGLGYICEPTPVSYPGC